MNVSNAKKTTPSPIDFEWAGAVARIRRGRVSSRASRRSTLLGVLTSAYANSSRGGRPTEPRNAPASERS